MGFSSGYRYIAESAFLSFKHLITLYRLPKVNCIHEFVKYSISLQDDKILVVQTFSRDYS